MTIYYQGPDVVITHEVFAVRTPTPQRFHIRELRQVHVVRGDLPPERMVTVHVAAGAFVAALVMAPVLDSPFALLVTATTAVSAMGANGLCVRLRPRTYEIRAIYQALDVCLYRSADLRTFGQVRRGLMRALERSEEADFNNWGTTLGAKAS